MSKIKFILPATAVAALAVAGCSHTTKEVVVTPAPVATTAQPAVIVSNAPAAPAPRVEVRPTVAPSAGYVWQDGYWSWRNGQYEWVPGHWQISRADQGSLNGGPN